MTIEALIGLPVFVLLTMFVFELERRAQYEAMAQHAACLMVRFRTLGVSWDSSLARTQRFLANAVGVQESKGFFHDLNETKEGARRDVRLHLRFPAFLNFPHKHHFEITKHCLF